MKKQQLLCFTIFMMTTSFFQGMEENKLSVDSIPTKSSLKIDAKVNVTDIITIFYIPDWKEPISPDELWYTNNDVNKMKAEYEEEKKQEEKKEQERKKREKSRQSMNKMFDAKK
ncbi:MAG: hypothetical protein ACXWL5_03340 [Candidatus Chromulinivorax sp.]